MEKEEAMSWYTLHRSTGLSHRQETLPYHII